MRNHIKTAYGISQESFVREHGPGQGNRMGPALWLIVSSFALDELERDAHGVDFADPTCTIFHHRVADAYVDDVTGFFNLFFESLRAMRLALHPWQGAWRGTPNYGINTYISREAHWSTQNVFGI